MRETPDNAGEPPGGGICRIRIILRRTTASRAGAGGKIGNFTPGGGGLKKAAMRAFPRPVAAIAVLALTLSGCGILMSSPKDRAAKNSAGFKSGYSDGCASASLQGSNPRAEQVRDDALYKTDAHYRSGWASGVTNCRNNNVNPRNQPNAGPIPDNSPGGHPY